MNSPTISRMCPVPRQTVLRSQNVTLPHPILAMLLCKFYCVAMIFSAVLSTAENDEWRYFGGLLVGSMFSSMAGVAILLLAGKPMVRQIIAARLIANLFFGLGLGAALVYVAGHNGWHTGPLFTVMASFLAGLCGVGLAKVLEPAMKRRAERVAEEVLDRAEATVFGHSPRPQDAPTVHIAPPVRRPPHAPESNTPEI